MKPSINLKKAIIEKCLSLKNEELVILKESQRQHMESAATDDIDLHDMAGSPRESMMQEIKTITSSLDFLTNQINILQNILQTVPWDGLHERVSLGSVVSTSMGNFLVAVAQDNFQVQNITYQGISVQSPLFKKIEGLSTGDKFDKKQLIFQVF